MSKSWADLIPNQTPCSHDKWREAENTASKYMMQAQATRDELVDQTRAIAKFATALGMYSGEFKAPTKDDFLSLRQAMKWDDRP